MGAAQRHKKLRQEQAHEVRCCHASDEVQEFMEKLTGGEYG